LIRNEVGHSASGSQPWASRAARTRSGRLTDEATSPQICERVGVVHRHEPGDATPSHRDDDLGALLYVLDVTTQLIVKLTYTDLGLERVAMLRHEPESYALHRTPASARRCS
jgi:hypothetical protein